MPSTVYKGDLTEVSFGHETAMKLTHDYAGTFIFYQSARDVSAGTSTIKFGGGAGPCVDGILKYPLGMLVGCRVTFAASANGLVNTVTGSGGNDDSRSDAGSSIIFDSFKLPSMDVNMAVAALADDSNESVLTDQFLGIASTVTLPETKVDLILVVLVVDSLILYLIQSLLVCYQQV